MMNQSRPVEPINALTKFDDITTVVPASSSRDRRSLMTVTEEVFYSFDQPSETANMLAEVRVSGNLSAERLREALQISITVHPMTRARLARGRRLILPPVWEIDEAPLMVPFRTTSADDENVMTSVRDAFCNEPIDLRRPPAVKVMHVARPGGDSLLLSMHHSIADGIGALRFVNSLARRYADRPDPIPDIDPVKVRDLRAHFNHSDSGPSPTSRPLERTSRTKATASSSARIAPEGGIGPPGCGVVQSTLAPEFVRELDPQRLGVHVTINDLLIAALHLAIARWNRARGELSQHVLVLVPINIRPVEWHYELVVNHVLTHENITNDEDRANPSSLVATVVDQISRSRAGEDLKRLLERPSWAWWLICNIYLPIELNYPWIIPERFKGPGSTTILANMGRVERNLKGFGGESGEVIGFWASPPVPLFMGLVMNTTFLRGQLNVSVRYRRESFDAAAVTRFLALWTEALAELGRSLA